MELVLGKFICNFLFHDLVHEAISRMFEKGLNVPEFASISGHKTASHCLGIFRLMLGYEPDSFPRNLPFFKGGCNEGWHSGWHKLTFF